MSVRSMPALLTALYLLFPSPIASQNKVAPPNEVRALWVVRTTLMSPEKIRTMVDKAADNGFNTIIVQVRGRGDAYYRSHREPRAVELKDQPTDFDPLAITLSEAKRRGLKVHAWINTSLLANLDALPTDPNHVYNKHPEWLAVPKPISAELYDMSPTDPRYRARIVEWSKANTAELEGVYTGPANAKVREHIFKIWMDVLKHYEVDGLHFDYVRLASPDFDYSRTSLNNFRKWLKRSGKQEGVAAAPGAVARPSGRGPDIQSQALQSGPAQLQTLAVGKGGLPLLTPGAAAAPGAVARPSGRALQIHSQALQSETLQPDTLAVRKGGLPPLFQSSSHTTGFSSPPFALRTLPQPQSPLALAEAYPAHFADFQREQITTLVQRIYREVKKRKPNVTVSAAVFANAENAHTRRFQDWRRWLQMGILDVVCPMAYTTDTEVFKTQIQIATQAAHAAKKADGTRSQVWAGIGAYRIPVDSAIEKINAARSLGADGIILFSYDATIRPNPLNPTADYLEHVRRKAFQQPAP